MINAIPREDLINQMENLIKKILKILKDEQEQSKMLLNKQNKDNGLDEQNLNLYDQYGHDQNGQSDQNDLSSTMDSTINFIEDIEKFQVQFDQIKKKLLEIPFEKEKCQQYLKKNGQIYKSQVQTSYMKSFINQNNSEIEQKKVEDIKQQLSNYIENLSKFNKLICPTHQKQVEFVNISNDPYIQERRLCRSCGKNGIKLSEFLEQYLMHFFYFKINTESRRSVINKQIQTISNLILSQKNTTNLYNDLNMEFEKRIQIIGNIVGSQLNQIDQFNNMAQDYVKTQDIFLYWKQEFDKNLSEKIRQDFENIQFQIKRIIDNGNIKILKPIISNPQNFTYTLLNKIQQSEICQVLCFNRNDTLLATARRNIIVIWSFQKGQMRRITELVGHQNEISCLLFDKDSDTLISSGGDHDRRIILWVQVENNKWQLQTTIQNDVGIKVMVFDDKNNLLITGCQKGIIKTFVFHPQISFIQFEEEIELESEQTIFGLSINDSKTKIVSCGVDMQLRLHKLDQKFECINQRNCDSVGIRIQFIDDESFVIVLKNGWLIYYKIEWKSLKEQQKIPLSSETRDYIYSPINYNQKTRFLTVKHYRTIYFLRRLDNGNFENISSLEYESNLLYASISNDGKYLVTWTDKEQDQKINENQIQQYQIYELQYQQV